MDKEELQGGLVTLWVNITFEDSQSRGEYGKIRQFEDALKFERLAADIFKPVPSLIIFGSRIFRFFLFSSTCGLIEFPFPPHRQILSL